MRGTENLVGFDVHFSAGISVFKGWNLRYSFSALCMLSYDRRSPFQKHVLRQEIELSPAVGGEIIICSDRGGYLFPGHKFVVIKSPSSN